MPCHTGYRPQSLPTMCGKRSSSSRSAAPTAALPMSISDPREQKSAEPSVARRKQAVAANRAPTPGRATCGAPPTQSTTEGLYRSHRELNSALPERVEVEAEIVVVGAGIIGAAIALRLQTEGHAVRLIDRGAPGRGASYGNMACIAVTEVLPLSRPSTWRNLPRWLLDREGSVHVRPNSLIGLSPWLLRFMRAGLPKRR